MITEALRCYFEQAWPALNGRIVVAPDGVDPLDGLVHIFLKSQLQSMWLILSGRGSLPACPVWCDIYVGENLILPTCSGHHSNLVNWR